MRLVKDKDKDEVAPPAEAEQKPLQSGAPEVVVVAPGDTEGAEDKTILYRVRHILVPYNS
jgi:hypothetical protein